ncbi:MAG: LptE family protein [Bacteroidales bacterium]|nr:LptE family protein [Bacteroidales bacterium]
MIKSIKYFFILIGLVMITTSCGFYSFTGASISPDVETVNVKYFPNKASLVQPTLSDVFTDALRDKFVSQTSLDLVNSQGDLTFEGEITKYFTKPTAIQTDQSAALNRLTIAVKVKFTNSKEPDKSFEQSFEHFSEYDAASSLSDVEDGLIEEIVEVLIDNIFSKAVVNW